MTIRIGDTYREGQDLTWHVYGMTDGEKGRRILAVNQKGKKAKMDPDDLVDRFALIEAADADAVIVWTSPDHPLLKSETTGSKAWEQPAS